MSLTISRVSPIASSHGLSGTTTPLAPKVRLARVSGPSRSSVKKRVVRVCRPGGTHARAALASRMLGSTS
jgi:hypothetical protein